ncbi:transcriptional regulator WhiB-like WhiB6 [Mycobacterium tuberculosis M1374]|nr:transcriptional regulator WhiB-like WhiB6 [Mycobacterium tuberculosis M1374]
MRDHRVSAQSA